MSGQFTLKIDMENEAVRTPQAVAELLREVAERIEMIDEYSSVEEGTIMDDNGNTTGNWEYENEPDDD